jgi:hypothetical protein
MSIKYRIQDEDAFLRVTAFGTCDDLFQLKEHILAISSAALSAGLTRVLVDEREMCYHLTTVDSFESGKFLAKMSRFGITAAVVYNLDGAKDTRFWETVAVNRGAALRAFEDVNDAEEWLRQCPSRRAAYRRHVGGRTPAPMDNGENGELYTCPARVPRHPLRPRARCASVMN